MFLLLTHHDSLATTHVIAVQTDRIPFQMIIPTETFAARNSSALSCTANTISNFCYLNTIVKIKWHNYSYKQFCFEMLK